MFYLRLRNCESDFANSIPEYRVFRAREYEAYPGTRVPEFPDTNPYTATDKTPNQSFNIQAQHRSNLYAYYYY